MLPIKIIRIPLLFALAVLLSSSSSSITMHNYGKKKIVIDNSNDLSSIVENNCAYIIIGIIDLCGQSIRMPANSVIDYHKGKIINGVIIGNDTQVRGLHDKCIGFAIEGKWIVPKIKDSFFDSVYLSDNQVMTNINSMQSDKVYNRIFLGRDNYLCSVNGEGGYVLNLSSNTKLTIKSTIAITGNDYIGYKIIRIANKENVVIKGGTIIGDVGKHHYVEGSTSQWGHGVLIHNSKHIRIERLTVTKCIGDGITITGGSGSHYGDMSNASSDVVINKAVSSFNRRQGLSLIHAENITIKNSIFSDTGVIEYQSPSAGIDIEPDLDPHFQTTRNIKIINCRFERNIGRSILANHYMNYNGTKSVSSVLIDDCYCDGKFELYVGGITVTNSRLSSLEVHAEKDPIEGLFFYKCVIGENGITLNCANKRKGIDTGIKEIVLNRCTIMVSESTLERNDGSPVVLQGKKENITGVILNRCKIKAQQ